MREVLTRDFIEINPAHFDPLPGGLLIDSDWTRSGFQLYHDNNRLISAPSSPVHKEKERKREREEEKREEEGRRFFGIGFFFSFYF